MSMFGVGNNPRAPKSRGSYADPHATIAMRDIPTNIKQVFRLCRFYHQQDALLGAIVDKMSEYPITQLVITEIENLTPKAREKWEFLANVALDLRSTMKNINTDKYVFGQSFHYLYYPFIRYCICKTCNEATPITALKTITVRPIDDRAKGFTLEVSGACPRCSKGDRSRTFRIEDRKSEARVGLSFVRMNPLRMELEYNEASGARDWYWTPPTSIREGLTANVRVIVNTTEMRVLEAAFRDQKVLLNKDRLWVAQADGAPGLWTGWGIPPIFRVLEDVYYYKILRRANEALAQEHVTPLRIISPSATGDISPQRTMNLADWQSKLRVELQKFKGDPNHILISPIPLNIEQMGGQARVMMVASEMEAAARVIAAGIGCPIEMIWGGLNWSGASVSLRVLENHFLNDRENSERLLKFLVPKLAAYFRLPRVDIKLSEFKMADDVQQQGNAINLMLQGFLSRQSVINEMGYDAKEEFDRMTEEHERLNTITMKDNVAAAHMNTVIQALEAKAAIMLQYELQIEQQRMQSQAERIRLEELNSFVAQLHAQGYATPLEFDQSAMILQKLPPQQAQLILSEWATTMPFVTQLLAGKMQMNQTGTEQNATALQGSAPAQAMGAAAGAGMAPGAAGPYSDGGQGTDMSSVLPGTAAPDLGAAMQPMPEQRPPQRANSPM